MCVLIYIDRHWKSFCEMLGRRDMLEDPRFLAMSDRTRNVDALYAFVAEVIATRTTAEWMEALARADIPVAPMHTPDSLMDDPIWPTWGCSNGSSTRPKVAYGR